MATAASLACRLGGQRQGHNWRCPCPLGCGYTLALADAEDGRLLAHCFGGCDYANILSALVEHGLFDDDDDPLCHEVSLSVTRSADDDLARSMAARWIYDHLAPAVGTAAEVYLRHRYISIAMPPVLRFGDCPHPPEGRQLLGKFARDMESRKANAGGLLRSAFGKARGTALRLSLVLEELWWCAQDGLALPPSNISERAFKAAGALVSSYFMPMAERVFGDAAATDTERMAATLARWIIRQRPDDVHVRHLQRKERLPGLRTAEHIKRAADALVEADWLRAPAAVTGFGKGRAPIVYLVNPLLKSIGV